MFGRCVSGLLTLMLLHGSVLAQTVAPLVRLRGPRRNLELNGSASVDQSRTTLAFQFQIRTLLDYLRSRTLRE